MPLIHRGFGFSILSDGVELTKHLIQVDPRDDTIISCYVPSVVGKSFTMRLDDYWKGEDILCYLETDGITRDQTKKPRARTTIRYSGKCNSQARTFSPYMFSQVEICEDEGAMPQHDQIPVDNAKLGLIELRVCRAKLSESMVFVGNHPRRSHSAHFSRIGPVSEKSKVMGSNCTMLGPAVPARSKPANSMRRFWRVESQFDSYNAPWVTFRIRHLPEAILRARGVIPASTPTVTSSSGPQHHCHESKALSTKSILRLSPPSHCDEKPVHPSSPSDKYPYRELGRELGQSQDALQASRAEGKWIKSEPAIYRPVPWQPRYCSPSDHERLVDDIPGLTWTSIEPPRQPQTSQLSRPVTMPQQSSQQQGLAAWHGAYIDLTLD